VLVFLVVGFVFFTDQPSENNTENHRSSLSVEKAHTKKKLGSIDMGKELPHKGAEVFINPFSSSVNNGSKLTDPTISEANIAQDVLEDKFVLDVNGNEILDVNDNETAASLSPDGEGDVGTDNEYGEGVAAEFNPATNSGVGVGSENEYGEGVAAEFHPGTNPGEGLGNENEYGEGVVIQLQPALEDF